MTNKLLKSILLVCVISVTTSSAQAEWLWDGGGADNRWDTAANWQDDAMPPASGHQIYIDVPDEGQPVFEAGMDYTYHGIRVGQVSEGLSTLTMTGGTLTTDVAPIFLGLGSYDCPATEGIMYFSGGTVNAENGFVLATFVGSAGTLNMSGTAVLNVSPMLQTGDDYRDHLTIACHEEGVLNMDGGTINSEYGMRLSQRSDGHGVVNMNAGTINLGGNLGMSSNEYTPYSEFYLNGGVVNAAGLDMTINARLDVDGGTMILVGDHTAVLQTYIDDGWITGYDGAGRMLVDYDVTLDKTTLAATMAPEPRPTLLVNTDTGAVTITNGYSDSIDMDLYCITSLAGSLRPSEWDSIQDQEDVPGFPAGDGTGNGWEEMGTPDANFLSEAFVASSSLLTDEQIIALGNIFDTAGTQDIGFEVRLANGSVLQSTVEYVTGGDNADFDSDGDVDGADFLAWQRGFGGSGALVDGDANGDGNVNGDDLTIWESRYGTVETAGSSTAAVPEPATGLLCLIAIAVGSVLSVARRGSRQLRT